MPTPAHELADRFEPEFQALFLAMIEELRRVDPVALKTLIERQDTVGIINLWVSTIGPKLSSFVESFGELYGQILGGTGVATISGSFDFMSPRMLAYINMNAGKLVKGMAETSVVSIRRIIFNGVLAGMGSEATGRVLRSVVGILPQHADAVTSYIQGLRESNYSPNQVAHYGEIYANRLRMYRAEMVARTETMTAANAGQQEAWMQMLDAGILQGHRTWKEWMVTEDDRLCPLCAPMDGVRVRINEQFRSTKKGFPDGKPTEHPPGSQRRRKGPIKPDPDGQPRDLLGRFTTLAKRDAPLKDAGRIRIVDHPPLHPSCRCAVVLRFDD